MPEDTSATTDVNPMDALDFSTDDDATTEVETQETTAEDSSTEENKVEKTAPETETDGESEEESTDGEDESEEQAGETDDEGESKPKNSAQNRIRSLANENRALKQQVEQLNAQFYRARTAEELQEQGMDESDSKIEALRPEMEMEKINSHITALNSDINMEAVQVMHDYPVFDPDSKDYDAKFAERVRDEWIKSSGLNSDPNTGLITQARVLPYDFYKSYAEAREEGRKQGEILGKRNYEKTANAADVTPVASPSKDEKKDPLMDILLAD